MIEFVAPPIFVAILFLCLLGLSGYYFYKSWFDVEGLRKSLRQTYARQPAWFPMRNYNLKRLQNNIWIWEMRVSAGCGLIFSGTVLTLLIIAAILAK